MSHSAAADPRQPSTAKPYLPPPISPQELPVDYSGFIAIIFGVVGVMFRYKLSSWLAIIFCAQSLANMKNIENDLKQISMAIIPGLAASPVCLALTTLVSLMDTLNIEGSSKLTSEIWSTEIEVFLTFPGVKIQGQNYELLALYMPANPFGDKIACLFSFLTNHLHLQLLKETMEARTNHASKLRATLLFLGEVHIQNFKKKMLLEIWKCALSFKVCYYGTGDKLLGTFSASCF